MNSFNITWKDVYRELGIGLLKYKNNRIELLKQFTSILKDFEIEQDHLHDRNICPFIIFNKINNIKDIDRRKELINKLLFFLKLDEINDLDEDFFKGVPSMSHNQIIYLAPKFYNDEAKVDEVWGLFEVAIYYNKSKNNEFIKYYNSIKTEGGGPKPKSLQLYWLNPDIFLPLDEKTRIYLNKEFDIKLKIDKINESAEEYLKAIKKIHDSIIKKTGKDKSNIQISYEAWLYQNTNKKKTVIQYFNGFGKSIKKKSIKLLTEKEYATKMRKKIKELKKNRSKEEIIQSAKNSSKKRKKKRFYIRTYSRDPEIVLARLYLANGVCDECENEGPFKSKVTGMPYLEVHHKKFLSKGGEDTLENTMALCPNCHRKKHHG